MTGKSSKLVGKNGPSQPIIIPKNMILTRPSLFVSVFWQDKLTNSIRRDYSNLFHSRIPLCSVIILMHFLPYNFFTSLIVKRTFYPDYPKPFLMAKHLIQWTFLWYNETWSNKTMVKTSLENFKDVELYPISIF